MFIHYMLRQPHLQAGMERVKQLRCIFDDAQANMPINGL